MSTVPNIMFVGLAISCSAPGTDRPAVRRASLQGDAFLVMQSGDVKRVAGNPILLMLDDQPTADSLFEIGCRIDRHTRALRSAAAPLTRAAEQSFERDFIRSQRYDAAAQVFLDSIYWVQADGRVTTISVLAALSVQRTETGIDGHYRFDSVAAGRYFLRTESQIGAHYYDWWAPVTMTSDSQRVDLNNSSVATDHLPECSRPTRP